VLKVSEVYEKQIKNVKERPDGSEFVNFGKVYNTRECLVNTNYVVSVHPFEFTSDAVREKFEGSFPQGAKFCTFVVDGNSFRRSEIVVVGSFEKFCNDLQKNQP
jgi:hypothetical protein|tara:strand:+ start:680 stop:991 length:312 start_codon:yes stop_codon:yes gene_type:complete